MKLRLGKMVNDLNEIDRAVKEGFDCAQLTIELIMNLNEEEFARKKDILLKTGLLFEIFSEPLPKEVLVTQKGFNIYVWTVYLKKALQRISELGCRKLCWSNGKARILPEEGKIMDAKEQFMQYLFMLCEMANNYGINILISLSGLLKLKDNVPARIVFVLSFMPSAILSVTLSKIFDMNDDLANTA